MTESQRLTIIERDKGIIVDKVLGVIEGVELSLIDYAYLQSKAHENVELKNVIEFNLNELDMSKISSSEFGERIANIYRKDFIRNQTAQCNERELII